MLHKFLSAVSLLTRIPIKLSRNPDYSRVAVFFPLVGLILGIVTFLPALLLRVIIHSPLFIAFLLVLAQYCTSNLFHLDGLVDTADASGVFGNREKKYQVLKDSRIGVYGFFAGSMMLSGKIIVLFLLLEKQYLDAWASVMLAMIFGRYSALLIAHFGNPVNTAGLGAALGKPSLIFSTGSSIACSLVPITILMRSGLVVPAAVIFFLTGVGAVIWAGFLTYWYAKNIGGYNGDAMGASIEITELTALTVSVAVLGLFG